MNSQQLKSTAGLRSAAEQWARVLHTAPSERARQQVRADIRAHMHQLKLPHDQLGDDELDAAVDDLQHLALVAPRLQWESFTHRLCAALACRPQDIGA